MTLDDLPSHGLGFAVYAYDPAGPVTLEIHAAEGIFTFSGRTVEDALLSAFPPAEEGHDDEAASRREELPDTSALFQ